MLWPIRNTGARLTQVAPDEVAGELSMRAVFDGEEEKSIVYEGMYYSQFDEGSAGLVVTNVTEIPPGELERPEHQAAAARLRDDCGADDAFLWDMYKRGNHLYIHHTQNGGVYIVLAKRLTFGETRLCAAENTEHSNN